MPLITCVFNFRRPFTHCTQWCSSSMPCAWSLWWYLDPSFRPNYFHRGVGTPSTPPSISSQDSQSYTPQSEALSMPSTRYALAITIPFLQRHWTLFWEGRTQLISCKQKHWFFKCRKIMQTMVIISIPVICCQVCYPHLVCHLLGIPFRPPAGPGLPTNAHFFWVPLIYLEIQEKENQSKRKEDIVFVTEPDAKPESQGPPYWLL